MTREAAHKTAAEPRATAGEIPVFCSHDELLPLEKIIPNPKNPNQHPKSQIELLAKIIQAQGWRAPITISTRSGFIVRGHGRLAAAQALGTPTAPVDYQNYSSVAEEYADLVADNRLAELAENNAAMLADILAEIDTGEMPLELSGYTGEDLDGILAALAGDGDAEPTGQDEEMEQPAKPMAKPGDLWQLGQHRLICGDSTDAATIDRLMNGEKAAMVHTDPPYGVDYAGGLGTRQEDGGYKSPFNQTRFDKVGESDLLKMLASAFKNYTRHTTEAAAFYIWHAAIKRRVFEDAMTMAGLVENQYLIWYKSKLAPGRLQYQQAHEPCFYASKEGVTPAFYGDRKQETVFTVTISQAGEMSTVLGNGLVLSDQQGQRLFIQKKPPKGKKARYIRLDENTRATISTEDSCSTVWNIEKEQGYLHPTQKPVELAARAIENSSQPGEIVADFFGGSGSTLLAAEQTSRICYTAELEPAYCDVIVSRYIMATGNLGATCIRDGQEMRYIDLVRQWAKENGKEAEIEAMKTPVVVIKKIVKAGEGDGEEE